MSSQWANACVISVWVMGSASKKLSRVASEKTTPKPKVSSGPLRSMTVTWCRGSARFIKIAKYRPAAPPPIATIFTPAIVPKAATVDGPVTAYDGREEGAMKTPALPADPGLSLGSHARGRGRAAERGHGRRRRWALRVVRTPARTVTVASTARDAVRADTPRRTSPTAPTTSSTITSSRGAPPHGVACRLRRHQSSSAPTARLDRPPRRRRGARNADPFEGELRRFRGQMGELAPLRPGAVR